MLYERWREIALANADQIALTDLAAARRWSFRALAAASESASVAQTPVAFPQDIGVDFVLRLLQAWRAGQASCPLEPGQTRPNFPGELPPAIAHFKTTSASTGTAKLVAFRASQMAADAANIVTTMGLRPEWPNIGVISLAHSYGFSNLVLPLLLHGIPLGLAGSNLPEALRRAALTQAEVTVAAVPALWRMWHEAHAIPGNVRVSRFQPVRNYPSRSSSRSTPVADSKDTISTAAVNAGVGSLTTRLRRHELRVVALEHPCATWRLRWRRTGAWRCTVKPWGRPIGRSRARISRGCVPLSRPRGVPGGSASSTRAVRRSDQRCRPKGRPGADRNGDRDLPGGAGMPGFRRRRRRGAARRKHRGLCGRERQGDPRDAAPIRAGPPAGLAGAAGSGGWSILCQPTNSGKLSRAEWRARYLQRGSS